MPGMLLKNSGAMETELLVRMERAFPNQGHIDALPQRRAPNRNMERIARAAGQVKKLDASVKKSPKVEVIGILDAIALIYGSNGKIFRVHFEKRTDGTRRWMSARTGAKKGLKGGVAPYNFSAKKLISVKEVNNPEKSKNGFKSLPWDGLLEIKTNGKHYFVRENLNQIRNIS